MSATFTDQPGLAPAEVDDQDDAPFTARPRSETRSVAWRLKHCAAPPAVIAAIACAGAVGQLNAQSALVTTGTYLVAAVLLWLHAEKQAGKDGRKSRRYRQRRKYRILASSAGLVWIAWADATSAGGWRAVTLLIGAYALGALGVALFGSKIPNPAEPVVDQPTPAPAAVVDSEAMRLERLYNEYLGCPRGRLEGARVIDRLDIVNGGRIILQLLPGQQSVETVRNVIPMIRTGLRCGDVLVEEREDDPLIVSITAMRRMAVRETQHWAGPRVDEDTGRVYLGPHIDGDGTAFWQLLQNKRLKNGFALSTTGYGKSALLRLLALAASSTGKISVVYADGSDGSSDPFMANYAQLSAFGTESIEVLSHALVAGLEYRRAENSSFGEEGFELGALNRPGVLVLFDECHVPLRKNKAIFDNFELLARDGNRHGIGVVLATQDCTVNAFGGRDSSDALRDAVTIINTFVGPVVSSNAGAILPDLPADPRKLPKDAGYFVCSEAPGRRKAPFRAWYADPKLDWDEKIPAVPLDTAFITAMGDVYKEWEKQQAAFREAQDRYVADMRAGRQATKPTMAAVTEAVAQTAQNAGGSLLDMKPLRLVATGAPATTRERILQELRTGGLMSTGSLVDATKASDTQVRKDCKKLIEAGLVEQPAVGYWRLTESGRVAS